MISDKQFHTYIDQGRKFYAFFETFDEVIEEVRCKGFNFYLFDQQGFVYFQATNATRQFVSAIADNIFYKRDAWTSEGFPYRKPLEADQWLDNNMDSAYALESVRQLTGLDLLLVKRGASENALKGEKA